MSYRTDTHLFPTDERLVFSKDLAECRANCRDSATPSPMLPELIGEEERVSWQEAINPG
ncbi:MAG TPA: hypothetical protein VGG72_04200 [Bryobacteraceae bacterium]